MQCNVVCLVHGESLISINLVTSTKEGIFLWVFVLRIMQKLPYIVLAYKSICI